MLILSALYRAQPEVFSRGADIKGRKRIYFAEDPQALLDNGKTNQTKTCPETLTGLLLTLILAVSA